MINTLASNAMASYASMSSANNPLQSGFAGFQQASQSMQNASYDLAKGTSGGADITQAAVSIQSASIQAQASAEVIRRSDSMLGSIIDIFA
jgi:flagellar hook-basal body complex protein FliE